MTTLPKFDETTIEVVDEVITIGQNKNYSKHRIEIPVSLWATFAHAIDKEIEKTPHPDLADEAFNLLQSMNEARAEELK